MSHKQVIVIRRDLKSRRGKEIAQGAHASVKAILDLCTKTNDTYTLTLDDRIKPWINGLFKKVCVYVESEQELLDVYNKAKEAGLICSIILDSGLTEFHNVPTLTCAAIGPDTEDKVNAITGHLKLY